MYVSNTVAHIMVSLFLDPASHPTWGLRFCRHFTISEECVETTLDQFPFHNYLHVCLTYRKITPPRAGHVTTEMKIFIDGQFVKLGRRLRYLNTSTIFCS